MFQKMGGGRSFLAKAAYCTLVGVTALDRSSLFTMSNDKPASLFSAVTGGDLITSLNSNDVILGRGKGAIQFIGNVRFRSRVEERQEEYLAVKGHRHPTKARISWELVYQTHALGGRFLKPVDDGSQGEAWYEVADSVALEKCQQALRDYRRKEEPSDGNDGRSNGEKGVREEESKKAVVEPMAAIPVLPLQFTSSIPILNGTRTVPYTYLPSGSMSQGLSQDQHVSVSNNATTSNR